jgi:hypothetical protein
MAEEKVIFEIDISSYLKQLADATARVDALKKSNTELATQVASGNKEAQQSIEKNKVLIKQEGEEYRRLQRVLGGYIATKEEEVDVTNFANNSISTNRKLLSQLTADYIKLKNPPKELTSQINTLTETLKKQESAIGNNTRNVGNYAEGFQQALTQLNVFGVNVGQVTGAIGGMKDGFTAAGGGIKGFSLALASTGLPLIIAGVTALTEALKSFAPVADFVEDSVAALSGAFNALATGRDIEEVSEQSVQLTRDLRDLEDAQLGAAVVVAKYDNEIKKLLVSLRNKTNSYKDNLDILDKLEEAERKRFDFQSKLAKEELRIAKEQLANKTGLYVAEIDALVERGNFIDKYSDEEIKKLAEVGGVSEDVIRATIKREQEGQKALADAAEAKAKISKKDLERISKLQEEVIKIEGESLVLQERFAARREEKDQKELERLQKQAEERQKIREKELKQIQDINDAVIDAANELIAEQEKNDAIDARRAAKKESERLKKLADEKQAFVSSFNAEQTHLSNLEKLEIAAANRTGKTAKEKQDEVLKIQLRYQVQRLEATRKFLTQQGVLTQADVDNIKLMESAIADLQYQIANAPPATLAESLGITPQAISDIQAGIQAIASVTATVNSAISAGYENRRAEIEATNNAEIAAIEASAASEENKRKRIEDANKRAAKAEYDLQVKQFETNKTVSIIQTVINTAAAIVAQLSNPTPYVGIALAALAAATGAAQIGIIAAQQPPPPPKFAKGVIGLDGAGTETSDSIPAYLSKGESVITAKATKRFAPQLAAMERSVGNVPNWNYSGGKFADGVIGDGGFYARDVSSQVREIITLADLNSALRGMPQPVVSVQEINRVNTSRNKSIAVSEL